MCELEADLVQAGVWDLWEVVVLIVEPDVVGQAVEGSIVRIRLLTLHKWKVMIEDPSNTPGAGSSLFICRPQPAHAATERIMNASRSDQWQPFLKPPAEARCLGFQRHTYTCLGQPW